MINKQRVLDEFLELIQIRCSTRQEREIGDLLTARLTALGGTVREDNAGKKLGGNCGNLVADFPGTLPEAPTVMLTAHMDCVEPCGDIHPIRENGIIRWDGTTILGSDDKAGVTAILETLRQLQENAIPHGPLQVVFTIAEENGVHGSQNMDSSLLHADLGYTLDTHGHPGTMRYKAPGKNQIHIQVQGRAAHAGVEPEKGLRAVHHRIAILLRFQPIDQAFEIAQVLDVERAVAAQITEGRRRQVDGALQHLGRIRRQADAGTFEHIDHAEKTDRVAPHDLVVGIGDHHLGIEIGSTGADR